MKPAARAREGDELVRQSVENNNADKYWPVDCLICRRVHLINLKTGKHSAQRINKKKPPDDYPSGFDLAGAQATAYLVEQLVAPVG